MYLAKVIMLKNLTDITLNLAEIWTEVVLFNHYTG